MKDSEDNVCALRLQIGGILFTKSEHSQVGRRWNLLVGCDDSGASLDSGETGVDRFAVLGRVENDTLNSTSEKFVYSKRHCTYLMFSTTDSRIEMS